MKFTSQDLAKAIGLKVGDRIETNGDVYVLNKIYKLVGEFINQPLHRIVDIEYTILTPKPILTEDEKVILRNLPKEYKWITRDCDGRDLCLHINKPERYSIYWSSKDGYNYLIPFNNLFNFIKWEDEPYEIAELLK